MVALLTASLSFLGSLLLTPAVAALARRFGAVDRPGAGRKRHRAATPLWGGVAVFVVFAGVVLALQSLRLLPHGLVAPEAIRGLLLGGLILALGGILDDRYDLPPAKQIVFPVAAVLVAVASGITIASVRNPFGGVIPLDQWTFPLGTARVTLPGDALSFLWILGIVYTTKVLDGLDGLVAGLAVIATALIFAVALRPELDQPDVAVLAAAAAGAFAGFLVWNVAPALAFLGEAGSTLAGFLIGSLAVISGSKVATTLLVLGAPVVDLAIVILGRARARRRIVSGDLSHLHFRLLTAGLSERKAILLLHLTAVAFGSVGLIAGTGVKAAAFLLLAACVVVGSRALERRARRV